jgi:hypothetical protein
MIDANLIDANLIDANRDKDDCIVYPNPTLDMLIIKQEKSDNIASKSLP